MRSTLLTLGLGTLLGTMALSPAVAFEPADDASQAVSPAAEQSGPQQQTAQQGEADGAQPADPNYRWHHGRWWYWQNGGWLLWDGSRWINQQERSARAYSYAPRRSFSYSEENLGYVPTDAGIPESSASGLRRSTVAPGTVEYQRVVPSYGLRSAGSKVLGNY